jgi:hypothetical protein
MKYSKKITVTEYLLHVSVHEIETNEGDNLFTLRQEKIQTQFLFDFDEIFTNRMSEARTYVIFCDYF